MVRAKVTVHKATDVPKMDTFGWADPYIKIKGAESQVHYVKSSAIPKEKNPVWNDATCIVNRDLCVRIKMYDKDLTSDDFIGEARVDIREAMDNVRLTLKDKQGKAVGETAIYVTVEVLPSPPKFIPAASNADAGLVMLNPQFEGHTSLKRFYSGKPLLPIVSIYEEVDAFCPNAQVLPAIAPDTLYGGRIVEHQAVLAKYEVPMGLVQRLDALGHFEAIDVIVDDSGSMQCGTDMPHPETGAGLTRWQEVFWRLYQMLEVMSMAPQLPPMTVRFLNSTEVLVIHRADQEPPTAFVARARQILEGAWGRFKSGGTPVMRPLQTSFAAYEGRPCMRFFYGDGVPNEPVQQIVHLIMTRPEPARNPFTFFSCTNDDGCTEWMKQCEEVAPFCAEYDDYGDEVAEMVHDQGPAFPFTMGVYLIASAVGACFPEDLDAMDEGVPLTKASLESILGYYTTDPQYRMYFDGMLRAVQANKPRGHIEPVDRIKFEYLSVWSQNYEGFVGCPRALDLPCVQGYKDALRAAIAKQPARR